MNLISRTRANNICSNFQGLKLLVVGDLMLDHWVWGKVSRISPEAPIPVVDVEHYSYTPGGAANVVANLKALGASADLMGVVGADDPGRRLRTMLRRQGVGINGVFVQDNYPTSLKSRIIANNQQVVRADLELRTEVNEAVWKDMLTWLSEHCQEYAAIILSDYDKGLFWGEHVQQMLGVVGKIPVIVGPKPANLDKFAHTRIVTLNASEAATASGYGTHTASDLQKAGRAILERLETESVVVTLGARGMALFQKDQPMVTVPALASQVFDVSGAGDTVLSVVAMCAAVGVKAHEAMCLASHAAAVVVHKVGTATVSRDELLSSLDEKADNNDFDLSRKILTAEEAAERIARLRTDPNPPTVVFTNGCFDVLHVGHLRTLISARKEGDVLVVGLNSDASVRRLKGEERPINGENDRAELLAGIECVDMVVIFAEDTPVELISKLRPDVHVKGGDYNIEDMPETAIMRSIGGKIVLTRTIPGRSTTAVVKKAKLHTEVTVHNPGPTSVARPFRAEDLFGQAQEIPTPGDTPR